jgi:hypothetical protein
MTETFGLIFARYVAGRAPGADFLLLEEAASDVVRELGEGDPPEPLEARISELYGRFGYHAANEALAVAIERKTALGDRRGGRPPSSVTRAKRRLRPLLRHRGRPGGSARIDPDRLAARDCLWVMLSDHYASTGEGVEAIARLIHARDNPEDLSLERIRRRLRILRQARKRAAVEAAGANYVKVWEGLGL